MMSAHGPPPSRLGPLPAIAVMLGALVLPRLASDAAGAGWAAAVGVGCAALLPVAVIATQAPGSAFPLLAPRSAWAVGLVATVGMTIGYDPLLDPTCPVTCAPLPGVLRGQADQDTVGLALALLVTASAMLRLPRGRVPATTGCAILVSAALSLWPWWGRVAGTDVPETVSALAVTLAVADVGLSSARRSLRRRRARAVASSLLAVPDRSVLPADLARDLDPAERLAFDNARLEAAVHDLADRLYDSRRQLVLALDAERARVGSDLHDLVQQRIVGVLLHTRALASDLGSTPAQATRLTVAAQRLDGVLNQMRGLSAGHEALGESAGLAAAIRARLADTTVDVALGELGTVGSSERRQAIAVVDAVIVARDDLDGRVLHRLRLDRNSDGIVVVLYGWSAALPLTVRDRIEAAGGRVRTHGASPSSRRPWTEVTIPCES